jgi:hypothetical protein
MGEQFAYPGKQTALKPSMANRHVPDSITAKDNHQEGLYKAIGR